MMRDGTDLIDDAAGRARLDGGLERLLGTVGEAMERNVLTLSANWPADVAAHALERRWVSGGPVVERNRVVGVVTLRDMLRAVAPGKPWSLLSGPFLRYEHALARFTVGQLMREQVVTARAEWPLILAVVTMQDAGVNRLPVVDERGAPVGIITRDDVLRAIAGRVRSGGSGSGSDQGWPYRGSQMPPD